MLVCFFLRRQGLFFRGESTGDAYFCGWSHSQKKGAGSLKRRFCTVDRVRPNLSTLTSHPCSLYRDGNTPRAPRTSYTRHREQALTTSHAPVLINSRSTGFRCPVSAGSQPAHAVCSVGPPVLSPPHHRLSRPRRGACRCWVVGGGDAGASTSASTTLKGTGLKGTGGAR